MDEVAGYGDDIRFGVPRHPEQRFVAAAEYFFVQVG
jgi:hypothetical protein